jgi:hypothetical protein
MTFSDAWKERCEGRKAKRAKLLGRDQTESAATEVLEQTRERKMEATVRGSHGELIGWSQSHMSCRAMTGKSSETRLLLGTWPEKTHIVHQENCKIRERTVSMTSIWSKIRYFDRIPFKINGMDRSQEVIELLVPRTGCMLCSVSNPMHKSNPYQSLKRFVGQPKVRIFTNCYKRNLSNLYRRYAEFWAVINRPTSTEMTRGWTGGLFSPIIALATE